MHDFVQAKAAELGIPDWREPTAYPKPDELWLTDWRWEFLRRNPQYREAYDRPGSLSALGPMLVKVRTVIRWDPSGTEEELCLRWREERREYFDDEDQLRYFKFRCFRQVFGLASPIDYRLSIKECAAQYKSKPRFIETETIYTKIAMNSCKLMDLPQIFEYSRYSDIIFRCDIHKPLKPQFKIFLDFASDCQRGSPERTARSPRKRKNRWPLYLRVLDARDCGATYAQIAQVLCLPHADPSAAAGAARDLVAAGEELRASWPFASEDEDPGPPLDRSTLGNDFALTDEPDAEEAPKSE